MSVIKVKLLNKNAQLPTRGSKHAAGIDLYSAECLILYPGKRHMVETGISVSIPDNTYLRIAPRSGLAYKFGIDVLAGVVDCDYTGPVNVILQNLGDYPFPINIGDRIAQGILESAYIVPIIEVKDIAETDRGDSGFGSTGS